MTAVNPTRPVHYPAPDGVRGLAILVVVFYHNFRYFKLSYLDWAGVDLFFVLSGFLITGILISEAESAHYLRNFFAKRVLRIFPLYHQSLIILLIKLVFYITRKYAGNDLPYFAVLGYPSLSIVFGLMIHIIVKNISPVVNRIWFITDRNCPCIYPGCDQLFCIRKIFPQTKRKLCPVV